MGIREKLVHKMCITKAQRSLKRFHEKGKDQNIKIASVDIFDTLLLRNTEPEVSKFYNIGKRQIKQSKLNTTPEDMLSLRLAGARFAYRNTKPIDHVREASYRTITNVISQGLGQQLHDDLLKAEIEHEKTVLQPNTMLLNILRDLKKMGKRIICISDMYFDHESINDLVTTLIPEDNPVDKIYVSSEYAINKVSGKLFTQVVKEEKIDLSQMVHCGDNKHSDYKMPKSMGVHAFYTPRHKIWHMIHKKRFRLFKNKYQEYLT